MLTNTHCHIYHNYTITYGDMNSYITTHVQKEQMICSHLKHFTCNMVSNYSKIHGEKTWYYVSNGG